MRARFPSDSQTPVKIRSRNYFKVQQKQKRTLKCNKLLLPLLVKLVNLSCQNLNTKNAGLDFIVFFTNVIG